jgi:tRNA (guanine37-N1)-methyltransferase
MVLQVGPVVECVEAVTKLADEPAELILLTPQGKPLNQRVVEELAEAPRMIVICGRYEGFDQRIIDILQPTELSIGDYVLNGGEVAAMVLVDAVMRLIPGVLGDESSNVDDSFSSGNRLLEFPQYTRPREYRGRDVPEVLLSGDHEAIARWRAEQTVNRTKERRGDLLSDENISSEGSQ